MTIKKLTPKSIKSFTKTLKNRGMKSSALEVFFDSIIELIDPYEHNISQKIDELMQESVFDGIDDANVFLHEYSDFTNSAIGFINSLEEEELEEDGSFETKVVNPLFRSFCADGVDCHSILLENIDKVLQKVIEVYEIDENTLSDINTLSDALGEEVAVAFSMLIMLSVAMHSGDIKKDNFETLRANFIILCSFVSILDVFRKEELEEIEANRSFVPRKEQEKVIKVGRNDPCPCGSGKKYKKCCINKESEKKSDPLKELDLPMATHFPLSESDVDGFYTIWTRLVDFSNRLYCDMYDLKYKKVYIKDEHNKYTFNDWVLEDNYILDLRGFLLTNFDRIVDDFIASKRVKKTDQEILQEWKKYRLYSDNFLVYEEVIGGALVWDISDSSYYYVYELYDSLYSITSKEKPLSMLLLPFKGRIIYDGLIGHSNVDIGQNMRETFLKDYVKLRKTKSPATSLPLQSSTTKIYQLKISIKEAKPPIWRRVLVEDDITYFGLHEVIYDIFDWYDTHLHEFITPSKMYAIPESELEDTENEYEHSINEDLKAPKDKIRYIYDFGDYWEHEIVLEDILEREEGVYYPRCIKGKGCGPLEDIGGIWAYNEIVKAYKDGDKKILDQYFVEDDFDPSYFDLEEINEILINPY
jgi:hypothetical protein